jgi:hypothetical protein
MSNAIEFLERLGRDASMRRASDAEFTQTLASLAIDPSLLTALRTGDQQRIETLLGTQTNVCCLIYSPEDDEDAPPEESIQGLTRTAA